MRPEARTSAAIELLHEILETSVPADKIIGGYFRTRKFAGSKDRGFIAELVYGVLRNKLQLEWWIKKSGLPVSARTLIISGLVLLNNISRDDLNAYFSGDHYSPAKLTEEELRFSKKINGQKLRNEDMPSNAALGIPAWMEEKLKAQFGRNFSSEIEAFNENAPLDLRVNTLKSDRDKVIIMLSAESFEAKATTFSPLGIRIEKRIPIFNTSTFKDGLIEVQDEASQIVSMLIAAKPGDKVLDFCAGAGGKTLAIAATMKNKGRIIACDTSAKRLEELSKRLKRAGVFNVTSKHIGTENDQYLKRLKGEMDWVLLDVPCSGTGTWRRNPDIKLRLAEEKLAEYVNIQQSILKSAARLVKPGGHLVYVTCSIIPDENQEQVDKFLKENTSFKLLSANNLLKEKYNINLGDDSDFLFLTPHRHKTDGFFAAVLQKI